MDSHSLQHEHLSRARAAFAEGAALPERLLPEAVVRSWERSRSTGLKPWNAPSYETQCPAGKVREHPDDRRLVRCVRAEIEHLWAAFGGRDWTVICVNPHGMIVHQRHHPDSSQQLLRPLRVGRRIRETNIGTTAPSCVVVEDRPAVVRGSQHYLSEFDRVFCLSVPLHGLAGELIGALDITGLGERDPALLLAHFRQAAVAAENHLISEQQNCHVLRVRYDQRWEQSSMQGLLAVDGDGILQAANRFARRLLDLPAAGITSGLHINDVFSGARPTQRQRLLKPGAAQRVPLHNGTTVFVDLVRAARGAQALFGPAVGQRALREQTLQAVARALHTNDGNISATARELGISRTTLYKKLRAQPR
ncbi:helix-turn-helix domain-containing protein [Burkholderia sp. MR1-5-21]